MAQLWWFYGNMSARVGSYRLWFMYVVCIHVTLFVTAFLIVHR